MILRKAIILLKKRKMSSLVESWLPVQPSDFIVLVIGIVIAKLGVQEFVTSPEHWDAVREQQQTAEILDLLSAERESPPVEPPRFLHSPQFQL